MLNLKNVHNKIISKIQTYCEELIKTNGDNIVSISLLEKSATQEWTQNDPIKIVVIFNELDFSILNKNLKLVSFGIKKGIIAPLFFTIKHIESSSDVFPIEFSDMRDRHLTVYGRDLLDAINVEAVNLRLECEQALKGKLIRLRQSFLEIGLKDKEIKRLIYESFQAFLPVFVNMLILKNVGRKEKNENIIELINKVGVVFDVNTEVLTKINNLEFKTLKGNALGDVFGEYLEVIRKLAVAVDEMEIV